LLTRPEASVTVLTPDKSWRLHWISNELWPEWKPRVQERLVVARSGGAATPTASINGERGSKIEDPGLKPEDQGSDPRDSNRQAIDSRSFILDSPSSILALPMCRIVEDLTGVWIVAEATGRRPEPWRGPVSEDPLERLRHLAGMGRGTGFWDENPAERLGLMVSFLDRVAAVMESFHLVNLVWLTFHPNALEETPDHIRATNLDLMVYPFASLAHKPRVVPAWAPPEVVHDQVLEIGPRTDVYHLALFTYYWLSRLLPNGFPGKGLAAFEFVMPPLRVLAPSLPVGIAGPVVSGLAMEPCRRPATPSAFCAELRAGVDALRAREVARWAGYGNLESENRSQKSEVGDQKSEADLAAAPPTKKWEIGSHTRTGRAKASKGGVNQDSVLIRNFSSPIRALVVVADGLSCCDVGSGDIASRLVCEAIGATFGSDGHAENFSKQIPEACRRGAEAMLAWALDHGEGLRLKAAQDLMSTTVLAAWLEANSTCGDCPELVLANAGDSRAYLINDRGVEQLTVDADLGCTLLAAGSPPENVVELGSVTRALRSCVGGVLYRSATDELLIDDARLRIAITRWKLLPGETVILCSDGLVEEGAFLEPVELLELVRCNADLSAEALAYALAEAADARQTLPSQEEPDGCGDNISCCVIRIK
jgi:serine/threonine protein phosphatase PrpC